MGKRGGKAGGKKGGKARMAALTQRSSDGIQTAELDRRDQVTATVPGPVPFERGEQGSITR